MTNTKQKLLEAKYFLERMIENESDRNVFKYNLSAFLAAFRSVTMIMQKEFKEVPGFTDWYKIQQRKMKTDSKMKLLNTKRTMTIHLQIVQPLAHVKMNTTENIHIGDSESMILAHTDGTIERYEPEPPKPASTIAKTKTITQWYWYFNEMLNIDVVTVCQECMTKLETIVNEFEQQFNLS